MNGRWSLGTNSPDDETFQTWENMRIEVLHELQEGADADVPDSYLDDLGTLVVVLTSWRAQRKPTLPNAFKYPTKALTKNIN